MNTADAIGKILGGLVFWSVAMMASSLLFSLAWNTVAPSRFSLPHLSPLESLCILSCIWLAGRMAGFGRTNVTVMSQE